jgi:replicative DNA helicase
MLDLYHETKPIDLTILAERLKRDGELDKVDGYVYLASLEQFVLATSAAIEHAQIVQEKATLRRLMAAADSIMHEASEERRVVQEQIELAEKLIFDVSQRTHSSKFLSLETLMQDTIEEVRHLMESRESSTSLKTHFIDLDQLINGFERTALVILAARPSIGKTAFALNLVRNVAVQGNIPVAFFSLEMGADQLNMRLLCSEARVPSHLVRKGRIKNEQWELLRTTASAMMDVPMWIDDTPGISLMQLRSRARRLKSRVPNLGLIVVDYLQLMTSPQRGREVNRQQEVSEISRGLKGLAKELQVPVLALSQLSRNIEQRSGKEKSARPMLSDLRESGAIEQDADVVMFVHRERVETQRDEDGNPVNKGEPIPTDIIVGKNRNGPIGTVPLLFLPDFTLFVNALQG